MTTLEIVTRHMPTRKHLLDRNQLRLSEQTCKDFVQTVIVDGEGVGILRAGGLIADHEPGADYVWILDDDDFVTGSGVIAKMVDKLKQRKPDIMFVKFNHGYAVLPMRAQWMRRPAEGSIGGSSIIVSAEIWRECRHFWRTERYENDFDYIDACYRRAFVIDWLDIVAAGMDGQRKGRAA
jgi:hypothetical protein